MNEDDDDGDGGDHDDDDDSGDHDDGLRFISKRSRDTNWQDSFHD